MACPGGKLNIHYQAASQFWLFAQCERQTGRFMRGVLRVALLIDKYGVVDSGGCENHLHNPCSAYAGLRPTLFKFFAGGGTARPGLGSAWRCTFAYDFDKMKVDTYKSNWAETDTSSSEISAR